MSLEGGHLFGAAEERRRCLDLDAALKFYKAAESAGWDADACAAGRWTCHMLEGDFALAWEESEEIARRGRPDPHRYWNGKDFAGRRVIIRCLHGLGDTIQFIRYAKLVRKSARSLTIEAQPTLKAILETSGLADQVITWGETEPDWDQQVEVVELPRIFRTEEHSIPREIPYLLAPGPVIKAGTDCLRVGLVWKSSSYDPARSVPVHEFENLCAVPGVSFFNLQAGPERFELCPPSLTIPQLYYEGQPFLDTACDLKALDLVITVDTMMAHLAGALGRIVWTLLPFECDWRWMLRRQDSPWYPTMRLTRQERSGDWATVLRKVRHELEGLVTKKASEAPSTASQ